ncbi:hypothetical protein Efla_000198 [Eimeria flavescens]
MPGPDVYLNIYKINGSPEWCAPCGLYHTSVQVGDLEYSFGEGAGVTCSLNNPRLDGVHTFQDGTYDDAMLKAVVGKGIPAHINRASRYGQWLSCLLPEGWNNRGEGESEGQEQLAPGICGLFGGNGHRLGGGDQRTIGEVGYRILGEVLRLGDCLRAQASVSDATGSDRCRSSHAFLAQAAQERMQRQLSQKASSIQ